MNRRAAISWAVLAALVAAAWFLCSRWADFPYFYHSDEPSKARQVIENTRNLHHPPFLLDATAALVKAARIPLEPQAVTEAGRTMSAVFCALAVGLLGWTMVRRHGWTVGALAGLLLLVQPDFQEYARYFKEDPALLCGCAACFAALFWFEEKRSWPRALVLGAGTALAVSGKYVGAVMILPALWVVLVPVRREGEPARRWPLLGLFLVSLLVVFAAINYRLITDLSTFRESLARETDLVLEGQKGVTKSIPHAGFLERLLNRSLHLLPFLVFGVRAAWRNRRKPGPAEWMLVCSPLALAVLLSFSTKDSGRYFLPAALGLSATAALGVSELAGFVRSGRGKQVAATLLAIVAIGASLWRSYSYIDGFRSDARRELLAWMDGHLPAGSRVLQGRKVCLPDPKSKFAEGWHRGLPPGLTVETTDSVPDKATDPKALAALGFTHVVLAGDEFDRYLRTDQQPKKEFAEQFKQRRQFYEAMDKECPILWRREPGKVGTHQPELKLYALPVPP